MEGASQDRGTFRGIALTLLGLALLAERAAGRSFPSASSSLPSSAGPRRSRGPSSPGNRDRLSGPALPGPALLCRTASNHHGAAGAEILALHLRMLAAVLGVLAGADACSDDGSARGPAGLPPHTEGAASRADPIRLLILPACRPRGYRSPPQRG